MPASASVSAGSRPRPRRLRDAAFGSPLSHNPSRGGAEAEANKALWIQSARASLRNRSCPGAATMGEIPTLAVAGSRSKPLLGFLLDRGAQPGWVFA